MSLGLWSFYKVCLLKTVVFIAGKENPATQFFFIPFSIENLIANISYYALSWPKLNFGCYVTFEIILKALSQWKNEYENFGFVDFFFPSINGTVFPFPVPSFEAS